MIITKNINGYDYEFEVTENYLIGKKIEGKYPGYNIRQETNGYLTKIFLKSTDFYSTKEEKLIGALIYKPEIDNILLYKNINPEEHIHIKSSSFGINNEIMKNLRTSDKILIQVGKEKYFISVSKAMKVGQYLHFNQYELQLFIPIKEFRKIVKKD